MVSVTVHKAKTQLSRLIQDALRGEEVVITRRHEPVARLVPMPGAKVRRRLGGAKGKVRVPKSFDEPLEDFADYMK
ncbi:MAG: type II toxin-antitoxin system Phd/YefM family antitoxin [Nitrospirae bacterium]|nr:type II toxin-antitoxin system Phd/YefM family antitoxin [Nitrospirota bacterium]